MLGALARELCCRVDLAELYELVIGLTALLRDKGTLMEHVLRTGPLPVAAVAYLAYECEVLGATGKAADEG